jgi:hypothetical protein
MSGLVPVRLLARVGPCNPNEVAGFPPEFAAQLIATGRAMSLDAAPAPDGDDQPPEGDVPPPEGDRDPEREGKQGEGENDDEGEEEEEDDEGEETSADGESSGSSAPPASTPAKARRPGNRRTS